MGVLADGYGTRVTLVDTIIRDTRTASVTRGGIGVDVQAQAVVIGEGLTIEGTDGPGVYVVTQGEFACDRCALTGNGFAGVVVLDGGVTLVDGAVDGSRGDASSGGGVGIYASGHYGPTSLSLDGVSLVGNRYAAVWLDGDGEYRLESSTLEGGAGVSFGSAILHGNAVFATGGVTAGDGTQGLSLAGSTLSGCRTAVLLHGASAALAGTVFTGNALDLQQQACATVDLPTGLEAAASSAICPDRWQLVAPLSYGLYLQDVSADR